MRTSFLFSFILPVFLYTSIESIIQVNSLTHVNAKCWDYPNPLRPREKVPSSVCGLQRKKRENERSLDDSRVEALTPTDIFHFDFTCDVKDHTLCSKAENELKLVGTMLANLINFNTPIKVNVTFGDFCKELGKCNSDVIGKAITARTIPLQDDGKVVRQYPQALVKQFLLEPEPQWGDYDINAYFNLHFYDKNISPDFQYIVLRELVYGFESFSGWENYFFNQIVTPGPGDPDFLDLIKSSNQVTIKSLTSSFNILYIFIIALIFFSYT